MKTQTKKPAPIKNREEAETLARETGILIQTKRHLAEKLDKQKTRIRKEFEEPIDSIEKDITANRKSLCKWPQKDRKTWQGKTLRLIHAILSFRGNPPSVKALKGWTLKQAAVVANGLAGTKKYVVSTPRLDHDLILKHYKEGKLTDDQLAAIGIRIDKDTETFTFDPQLTETPTKQKETA